MTIRTTKILSGNIFNTSFDLFKERFLEPMNIKIDEPGQISYRCITIDKVDGQWRLRTIDITTLLTEITKLL